MYEAGERFRDTAREIAGEDVPPIGVTRVGLHRGEAVVGNFGGEGRIQYTALGDAMNTAARLESANKALKTTMLVSDEAKRESTLDLFRPMGRIVLSGRATPVDGLGAGAGPRSGPRRASSTMPGSGSTPAIPRRSFSWKQSPPRIRRMRRCNISSIDAERSVLEVTLSWGPNSRFVRRALIAGAMLATTGSAAANVLVVRSSGPSAASYRAGQSLPDNARITLRAGDQVMILANGGTRTFRGPGTFSPERACGQQRDRQQWRADRARRCGSQRRDHPERPTIWHVDVTQSGTFCLASGSNVMLWRPDASAPVRLHGRRPRRRPHAQLGRRMPRPRPCPAAPVANGGDLYDHPARRRRARDDHLPAARQRAARRGGRCRRR